MSEPLLIGGKKYISTKVAARNFNYTSDYVGQLARDGKIDSTKVGRSRFVCEEDLAAYVETSRQEKQRKSEERVLRQEQEREARVVERVVPTIPPAPQERVVPVFPNAKETRIDDVVINSEVSESGTEIQSEVFGEASKITLSQITPISSFSRKQTSPSKSESKRRMYSIDELYTGAVVKGKDDAASEASKVQLIELPKQRKKIPFPSHLLGSKTVALVVALALVLSPYFFFNSPSGVNVVEESKTVTTEIARATREDGLVAFVAQSVGYSVNSVGKNLELALGTDIKGSSKEAFDLLASHIYLTIENGGVAALLENAVVGIVRPSTIGPDYVLDEHHYSANVFSSIGNAFSSITDFFASLFEFETELTRVVIDNRPEYVRDDVPLEEIEDSTEEGIVLVSREGASDEDEVISKIKKSFSDEVQVIPDETGDSGVIKPIFKDSVGDDFLYVLVPVHEDG